MKKKLSIIVAIAQNNAIGKDNKLLWHITADLKRFKKLTGGNTVVMGKNTYYSLPLRPLPNRTNIVITDIPGEKIEGCTMAYSIDDAIRLCDDSKENFIIGGGTIYRQFLPLANKLYITKVNRDFDADCFFQEIDFSQWNLISSDDINDDPQNDFTYSYLVYEKRDSTFQQ